MSFILGILLTFLILSIVVFIHEMGHFLTARMTKMKVDEFGIGLPPLGKKMYTDSKGTDYTLNWLPIGGFVRIKGEDAHGEGANDTDSFMTKNWWQRSLVLVAGVTMNFILAWFIFTFLFFRGTSPLAVNYLLDKDYGSYFLPSFEESIRSNYLTLKGIEIDPESGGPAAKQGIVKGDILLEIDGKKVEKIDDFIHTVKTNTPMELTILSKNDGKVRKISIVPVKGKIQAYLTYGDVSVDKTYKKKFSLIESLYKGADETIILSRVTFDFLGKIVHDLISPKTAQDRAIAKEMVSGPIGMGAGMIELVKSGLSINIFFIMVAFLSINLAIFNILPFPALDGGRLVSTTVISFVSLFIKKRERLLSLEKKLHGAGMLLLLLLMIFIAIFDILKL